MDPYNFLLRCEILKDNINSMLVTALLEKGANPNIFYDSKNGRLTALEYLAMRGCVTEIFVFLTYLDHKNIQRDSALYYARRHGHEKIVTLLLNYDTSFNNTKELQRNTVLDCAAKDSSLYGIVEDYKEIIRILLNYNVSDFDQNATYTFAQDLALNYAAYNCHEEVVKLLLNDGANPNRAIGDLENTALHCAAHSKSDVIIQSLLKHGAEVGKKNIKGNTPLYIYLSESKPLNPNMVSLFLDKKIINETNKSGRTVLQLAVDRLSVEIIRLLLDSGAKVTKSDLALAKQRKRLGVTDLLQKIFNLQNGNLLPDNRLSLPLFFNQNTERSEPASDMPTSLLFYKP
jgi:ankyrin repeat protein